MLKFYILVSRNIAKVQRHLKYLDKSEVVFVINTLDKEFEKECSQLLHLKRISYHITESNGTPAKGKNSLLEIFKNSDNDYCVQVDGDDCLTPHGINLYKQIASSKNPPDAICLRNQMAEVLDYSKSVEEGKALIKKLLFFKKKDIDFEQLSLFLQEMSQFTKEEADTIIPYHKQYYKYAHKYVDPEEAHCRVVFFSKKAANYKFPENFLIAEDTLHYLLLKNAHFSGEIKMVSNDERPVTYIYDQTDGDNTVFTEIINKNWEWMNDFNKEVQKFKKQGILHEKQVPQLKVRYKSCVLDDLDMSGLAEYEVENKHIKAPANADYETLKGIHLGSINIAMKNNS